VVSVFFEPGREPAAASAQGMHALRLDDMLRHTHLQAQEQIVACLDAIDEALRRVRAEPGAALTALDGAGHCLVAHATAQSVQALWREIVTAHDLARAETTSAPGGSATRIGDVPIAMFDFGAVVRDTARGSPRRRLAAPVGERLTRVSHRRSRHAGK
jgi:hypothetical protein